VVLVSRETWRGVVGGASWAPTSGLCRHRTTEPSSGISRTGFRSSVEAGFVPLVTPGGWPRVLLAAELGAKGSPTPGAADSRRRVPPTGELGCGGWCCALTVIWVRPGGGARWQAATLKPHFSAPAAGPPLRRSVLGTELRNLLQVFPEQDSALLCQAGCMSLVTPAPSKRGGRRAVGGGRWAVAAGGQYSLQSCAPRGGACVRRSWCWRSGLPASGAPPARTALRAGWP
jgi:hypothetical protein